MILPNFSYFSPRSLDEALSYLSKRKGNNVKILGGGTDLLVDIRQSVIPFGHRPPPAQPRIGLWQARSVAPDKPGVLLALSRIPELRSISQSDSGIRIGAMTTITDLERSEIVKQCLRGLWDGAYQLGSPLVRNRGTIGGNIVNARPAADTAIPTLALSGKLLLKSVRGERIVDHDDFVTGPGKTIIEPDEILTEILFDPPISPSTLQRGKGMEPSQLEGQQPKYSSSYIKLANRKSLEISVVGAACSVQFDEDGTVLSARVALGAVAPKPLLVSEAGESLIGKRLTPETALKAGKIAESIAKPITDHRGSEEYRNLMIEVLVKRALMQCKLQAFAEEVAA